MDERDLKEMRRLELGRLRDSQKALRALIASGIVPPIAGGVDSSVGYDEPAVIDLVFDSESLGGAPAKHRERVQIGGSVLAEIARVKNVGPVGTDYGLVTRDIPRREGQVLSTTALGISGVFTQAGQDGTDDGVMLVAATARADVASATDGFVIEEYDGADDDFADAQFIRTVAAKSVVAATTTYAYAIIRARKWRVKYTNGGTAQTTFKLTASVSVYPALPIQVDYDTGTGIQELPVIGIALPGAGGAVAGGTATNPLRTDPTGTTTQPVSDAGGSLTVDAVDLDIRNLVAATDSVDTELPAAIALAEALANPTITAVGAYLLGFDGTDWNRVRVDPTTFRLEVEIEAINAALAAGANNIGDVDIASFVAGAIVEVQGDVAHGVAVAGNPVLNGFEARSTDPTAVTSGQAVRGIADLLGKQVVLPFAIPERFIEGSATLTLTTDVAVIAAAAAGIRNYLTEVTGSNTSATNVRLDIKDGTTIKRSFFMAANGGGFVWSGGYFVFRGTAATAVNMALGAAVTDVRVGASGFLAP